jgi:ATP-dependent Lon protease
VLIPKDNEKDLAEIPENAKKALEIVSVSTVDEVLARALTRVPQAIEWIEPEIENVPTKKAEGDATGLVTH